jgi:hypothetical protein
MRGMAEDLFAILDKISTGFAGGPDQHVQFLERGSGWVLEDDVGAGDERVQSRCTFGSALPSDPALLR